MHETDLELHPNEASDLCRLEAPGLLEQRGWDRVFLTVLDEPPAEECLAVLGHERKAEPGEGWEALRVKCAVEKGEKKTHDAEACARHEGWVYLLGSQYGGKKGPLDRRRSWIARAREDDLADAIEKRRTRPARAGPAALCPPPRGERRTEGSAHRDDRGGKEDACRLH